MGSSFAAGEMCMDSGRRRGGKKAAANHHKANKQPQRGLGVAQLEKIRLHNQMMAAYRHHQDSSPRAQQAPFAAAPALLPFNLQNCFEETERGIVAVHYYDGHLPHRRRRCSRTTSGIPPATGWAS
uniref:Uncharacterized protein n=1 Tax=Setaria viridis TaxID=4556 RepID=A0A4U6UE85_SETVI|nr:hypothetical protein SEVIR_5G007800v2 [Setaria viridis]